MQDKILRLLSENARWSDQDLAKRLNISKKTVKKIIKNLEDKNIIYGYKAIVNEAVFAENEVKAIIEVRITPRRNEGYDKIAERIGKFPEVTSLYLVSGGYDLQLIVEGKNLHEIASFVSGKLALIEGVISTTTHFLLKKYKEFGKILHDSDEYEKLKVTP